MAVDNARFSRSSFRFIREESRCSSLAHHNSTSNQMMNTPITSPPPVDDSIITLIATNCNIQNA